MANKKQRVRWDFLEDWECSCMSGRQFCRRLDQRFPRFAESIDVEDHFLGCHLESGGIFFDLYSIATMSADLFNGSSLHRETVVMRIGHCQLDSLLGAFEVNLQKMIAGLERADAERVEIVSFPECFLTGYPDDGATARRDAFAIDSPQVMRVLDATSRFESLCIVGFNELRGPDLYNTALIAHKGHLLGHYSKCSAYQSFHKQGRQFPVFKHKGLTLGVIICSDGGYIEPTRLLALQGAQVVFAPHFNYIGASGLIAHFMKVRADHIARAVENSVYFVRGNNVSVGGQEECITGYEGIGYGDSYIVDPHGEIVVRSRRHQEDFIFADIVPEVDRSWGAGRSLWSAREFGKLLGEIAAQNLSGSGAKNRAVEQ